MHRPIYELHKALKDLLELAEILMAETGRKPASDGAISHAKTALQIHEGAADSDFRSSLNPIKPEQENTAHT